MLDGKSFHLYSVAATVFPAPAGFFKVPMKNPGKYDNLCTLVREKSKAKGAIVIIFDGTKGHGFSVQAPPIILNDLPEILEDIAKTIRNHTI